jgi:Zn-dependent peptidase ImmA (M78 family)
MKYKILYVELAELLTRLGCQVCDHDLLGYCFQPGKSRGFIVIRPNMNYKEKYFILSHEAGHLFRLTKDKKLRWTAKIKTEEEANLFAVKLLKFNEIEREEYYKIYAKAKEKMKKRKKSWFEI